MKDHPDLDAVERGALAPDEAAAARAHVEGCEACRDELAWRRAERELFARRRGAAPSPAALWSGVEARLERRRGGGGRLLLLAVTLSAAAVIVLTVWPRGPASTARDAAVAAPAGATPDAAAPDPLEAALDRAEAAYRQAVGDLEADYRARRASLDPETARRLDARFAAAHRTFEEVRAVAGDDPRGRARMLRAYGRVVHGLQAEANAVAEERP